MAAKMTVVWWRDIPAQVKGRAGRAKASEHLGERFEKAIDRAAMRARMVGTDAYLEQWRRVDEEAPEGAALEAAVADRAEALRAEYDDAALERLVLAEGTAEGVAGGTAGGTAGGAAAGTAEGAAE